MRSTHSFLRTLAAALFTFAVVSVASAQKAGCNAFCVTGTGCGDAYYCAANEQTGDYLCKYQCTDTWGCTLSHTAGEKYLSWTCNCPGCL